MVGRRWIFGAAVAVGVLWVARSAWAQEPVEAGKDAPLAAPPRPTDGPPRRWLGFASESARTATRLPVGEREARAFLREAALLARLDTEASRLAQSHGQAPGVLAYSDNLLGYHEGARPELLHLLHVRGMALPMMDGGQRKALNRLARLKGARFDRGYADLVGPQQQRLAVQRYEKALAVVDDAVLRAWIERQLPALRQQQEEATRNLALAGEPRAPRRGDGVRSTAWPGGRATAR